MLSIKTSKGAFRQKGRKNYHSELPYGLGLRTVPKTMNHTFRNFGITEEIL